MQISNLAERFEVTQYQLDSKAATAELVDGAITVTTLYRFRSASGRQIGIRAPINMIVTQQQSDYLKAILSAVLAATNAAIETELGWTQWTPSDEEE